MSLGRIKLHIQSIHTPKKLMIKIIFCVQCTKRKRKKYIYTTVINTEFFLDFSLFHIRCFSNIYVNAFILVTI